ncbi:MAG: hypothetical protein AB1782_19125 [Cyanobacteriota bacterium]
MNDVFDFIAIKKLQVELLLKVLTGDLSLGGVSMDNLYVSILPPFDGLYLIEFADYLPVTRYGDVNALRYLQTIARSFNIVFYLYKNDQTLKSKYQKYIRGKLELEHKGEKALTKGLRFDLVIDDNELIEHVQKVWSNSYSDGDLKPHVYQIVKDKKILEKPIEVEYTKFYAQ